VGIEPAPFPDAQIDQERDCPQITQITQIKSKNVGGAPRGDLLFNEKRGKSIAARTRLPPEIKLF
jgi:hypothetical protein